MRRITEAAQSLLTKIKSLFRSGATESFTIAEPANETYYGISVLDHGKYRPPAQRAAETDEKPIDAVLSDNPTKNPGSHDDCGIFH